MKAPFAAFAREQADVSAKWAMYYASGVADKDYRPGTIKLTLHLGAAKQTIDLGPVFVLGTSCPLTGVIRKGDMIFIAFYARAVEGDGVISSIRAQMNRDPWTPAVETSMTVQKDTWKLFTFSGVAQADLPAGVGMLSAQIGSTKQVMEFGPAFVLNLGQGVQLSALPRN